MSSRSATYTGISREGAPLHSDVAQGPEDWAGWWLMCEDGVRIRVGVHGGGDKGTVLIFPGRTEYIEKYGPFAADLAAAGFSSLTIDWRGQGLADRALENRNIGHIDDFKDYQKDLRAVKAALSELDLPKPYFLLGHSMGGCIGLRSLMEGLDVKAVTFSAPMWDISLSPLRKSAGWAVSHLARQIGLKGTLAPGTLDTPYAMINAFEDNMLTTDPEMYGFMRAQLTAYPDLSLGGPSMAWLNEALIECRTLSQRPTPKVPALTLLGTAERIVDVKAVHERMARWSNGTLQMVEGAEHEVLMEIPSRRKAATRDTIAHFAAHR